MAERQVSDCPVLRHLLPHQGHLQGPMGAGLGVQRPVMLTLHLGGDGGGSGYRRLRRPSPGAPPRVALAFSIGDSPRPGNQVESGPSQEASPSSGLPEQLRPVRGPAGALGKAGGVQSCWEPPRFSQGPPRDPCLGQDHRLEPGGRPPQPGAPLTRPDSTQLVSMTRVWLCCSHTRRQKSPTVCGRGPWAAMNSWELQRPWWREAGGSGSPCPLPPALTFRGSDPSLTGMKLALMYSEPGCPRRARRGTRDQSSEGRRWS